MAKQNIYDNETFFEGYKKLRTKTDSANDVFEIPVLFSMLPDLNGKNILDLGCGFGEHCVEFINRGAAKVVGIDISEKMLEVAKEENSDPKIEYICMPMEDIDKIEGKFDVVISSLAFHYIEDFDGVVRKIADHLNPDGLFIFSQEHPLNTCHSGGDRWERDENGNKLHLRLKDYSVEGEYESVWFVDNVKRYHRKFATIVNTLAESGFMIEKMEEPSGTEEIIRKYPKFKDLSFKPDFLIVRARKTRG